MNIRINGKDETLKSPSTVEALVSEKGLSADRIAPENDKDGSFELLAYYHLGIPSFALDFWTPPAEKTEPKSDGGKSSARAKSSSG